MTFAAYCRSVNRPYPDAWVYRLDADGITRVGYEDTAHFRVMKDFMADPRRMLGSLLAG